jgi:hypothetical protein
VLTKGPLTHAGFPKSTHYLAKRGVRCRMFYLLDFFLIALIILFACITVKRRWFADPTEPPAHPDDDEWW